MGSGHCFRRRSRAVPMLFGHHRTLTSGKKASTAKLPAKHCRHSYSRLREATSTNNDRNPHEAKRCQRAAVAQGKPHLRQRAPTKTPVQTRPLRNPVAREMSARSTKRPGRTTSARPALRPRPTNHHRPLKIQSAQLIIFNNGSRPFSEWEARTC